MKSIWFGLFIQIFAANAAMASDDGWTASELIGHEISLVSKTDIVTLSFGSESWVSATLGTVGGPPPVGPVLRWKIDKVGVLIANDEYISLKIKKIRQNGDRYAVLISYNDSPWEVAEFQKRKS